MNIGVQITKSKIKFDYLISLIKNNFSDNLSFIHIKNESDLLKKIKNLDVLVTYKISPKSFKHRSERLKWIHIGASGIEQNLFAELIKSKVTITNAKGINANEVAEFIMAQILYFAKKINRCNDFKLNQKWNQWNLSKQIIQLNESTLGIIGYGQIGKKLAKIAKSFGMYTIATRRLQSKVEKKKNLDELLPLSDINKIYEKSDFLVLCCPLTPQTKKMINDNIFKKMKSSSIIINISRGPIIDEKSLINALLNKQVAGAALDVFDTEPLTHDSNLFKLENVLLSPHISGNFENYHTKMIEQFSEILVKFTLGKPLKNKVCKRRLY